MTLPDVLFGAGLETGLLEVGSLLRQADLADRFALDVVSMSDHPYFPDRLDSYAALGMILGRTTRVTGAVNVTNIPSRPAPMLARTITSLSELSGGRVALGIGGGGLWDEMAKLGIPARTPGQAVRAMEEAITVVRALSGDGGRPVHFDGEFYSLAGAVPAPVPTPPIWTGSLGPQSLGVTGRLADGWIPGHAADWRSRRVAESRPIIDEAAVSVGRDPSEIGTIYNIPGLITAAPLPATRRADGRWIGGSVEQWTEELVYAATEIGARGFVYFQVNDGSGSDMALGRWAGEVVPAVREALGPALTRPRTGHTARAS